MAHSEKERYTIAFYNVENLFDTRNNPAKFDNDFTPDGFFKWTKNRLRKKVDKIAKVLSQVGKGENEFPPVIIGLAEVENSRVLDMLTKSKYLEHLDYGVIHQESRDERGIDVGLLYRKKYFNVEDVRTLQVELLDEEGLPDFTRDILNVKGTFLGDETFQFYVNHWPSRRDGPEITNPKRKKAAKVLVKDIESQTKEISTVIMGDFNDDPNSESIKDIVVPAGFYNPMQQLLRPDRGTLSYRRQWNLFDQILISHDLLQGGTNGFSFAKAEIHDPTELKQWKGPYKGTPFRTFGGGKYKGGYSDHFPVYIYIDRV